MSVIGLLRNPTHTGERRCVPCTIGNLGLLWLLVNAFVLIVSPTAGVVALVAGICAIWLRGYLVPLTPRFAPKLVAALPVPTEWFHDTQGTGSLAPDAADGEQLIATLTNVGVLDVDDQQSSLDAAFERRWHDEMAAIAARSPPSLAGELESLPAVTSARAYESDGQRWLVLGGQEALVPHHVAVAELGAVRALEPVIDDAADRLEMARSLREFLTECPVCDTAFQRSTAVACCGGHTDSHESPRQTLVCPECEQRFLLLPADPVEQSLTSSRPDGDCGP